MEFRRADKTDTPAIVSLLKLSLGESLIPKSEEYWEWKHEKNPFGKSPVLVCVHRNEIVGVRAFMRWQWASNEKLVNSLRAVDTATHPNFQGKGIFKNLTLSLIDSCGNHEDFIFNTPNKNSKPGYLKMGWVEAGRLPIVLNIRRPYNIVRTYLNNGAGKKHDSFSNSLQYYLEHPGLDNLLSVCRSSNKFITNTSVEYLKWRYLKVPVATYVGIGEEHNGRLDGLIIARIKGTRFGTELRVTDVFVNRGEYSKLRYNFEALAKDLAVDYCTISGLCDEEEKKVVGGVRCRLNFGPFVTIRRMGLSDLNSLIGFKSWAPSIGDLELF